MKCCALWLLILSFMFHHTKIHSSPSGCCQNLDYLKCSDNSSYKGCCIDTFNTILEKLPDNDVVKALSILQNILSETTVNDTLSVHQNNIVVLLYKPTHDFKDLTISASDNEAMLGSDMPNSTVIVHLPSELNAGPNNTIVFVMIRLSDKTHLKRSEELYDRRIIGLSVRGKNILGLKKRVSLTIKIATSISETLKPQCEFLNTTEENFSPNGCETQWDRDQGHVTCVSDHLTYFGVLMVSADLSSKDQEIMSYITYIGCSISLAALVIAVLLFITNRKVRGDDSKKIHISLAVALILLNIHFLSSQAVAAMTSNEPCCYVALLLHYSLLASFTWMALEGFHLYLLLVKVFNIYIKRYLLKLSVVGWGLPAVIVSVALIIDKDSYGRTRLIQSENTTVCYISNEKVKMGTTLGLFSVVFLFNVTMFGLIAKRLMGDNFRKQLGVSRKDKAKREVSIMLSLMVLLGLTWGLIFFSFGQLTTPGLYVFCLLNPLQGLFILIYFILSMKKIQAPSTKPSSETHSTKY